MIAIIIKASVCVIRLILRQITQTLAMIIFDITMVLNQSNYC